LARQKINFLQIWGFRGRQSTVFPSVFLKTLRDGGGGVCIQVWEKEGTAHKKEIGQWLQGEFVEHSPGSLTPEVIFRLECWPCTGLDILLNKFFPAG
jgi:hypothetical protein